MYDKKRVVERLTTSGKGHYYFKVILYGMGNNADEAWEKAVEDFCNEPEDRPDNYEFNEDLEEE